MVELLNRLVRYSHLIATLFSYSFKKNIMSKVEVSFSKLYGLNAIVSELPSEISPILVV